MLAKSAALVCVCLVMSMSVETWQRTVRATDAWIGLGSGATEATLSAVIDNGTMYDVYLVGATSDVAGAVELRETKGGAAVTVKEATVPSFGQLPLSANGIHLVLRQLKRPLKSGESVNVVITLDNGSLEVAATVK